MSGMETNADFAGSVKIVSGGQTGVDRAALDVALALDLPHGGWCPRGRRAEDGPIGPEYALVETESAEYPVRTERNIIDSDGTLIIFRGRMVGGTSLTRKLANKHKKPVFSANLALPPAVDAICRWLSDNQISILNVAGPRESTSPGIYRQAEALLRQLLSRLRQEPAGRWSLT
jgi:hypothetical protein